MIKSPRRTRSYIPTLHHLQQLQQPRSDHTRAGYICPVREIVKKCMIYFYLFTNEEMNWPWTRPCPHSRHTDPWWRCHKAFSSTGSRTPCPRVRTCTTARQFLSSDGEGDEGDGGDSDDGNGCTVCSFFFVISFIVSVCLIWVCITANTFHQK